MGVLRNSKFVRMSHVACPQFILTLTVIGVNCAMAVFFSVKQGGRGISARPSWKPTLRSLLDVGRESQDRMARDGLHRKYVNSK